MLYDWLEFVLWLNITSLKRLKFLFKKIKKMYEYQTTNTRDQHKKIAHTFKTWLEKEKIGKKLKWKTIKNQLIIGVDSPTGKECFLPYSSSLANLLTTLENTMVSIFLDKKSTSSQSPIEHRWVMTSASSFWGAERRLRRRNILTGGIITITTRAKKSILVMMAKIMNQNQRKV